MPQSNNGRHYIYSSASTYPKPTALLIDENGDVIHSWSNPVLQPPVASKPASFVKGWNHVEVAPDGDLLVIVPLRGLVRLRGNSEIVWHADAAVHHDLAVHNDGSIYVLTERPRIVAGPAVRQPILDNFIQRIHRDGTLGQSWSLFDILAADREISVVLNQWLESKVEKLRALSVETEQRDDTFSDLDPDDMRSTLSRIRRIPGSPCDILHSNSIEFCARHPGGLWSQNDVIVSFRNLDLLVVIDLVSNKVVWKLHGKHVSGQHQPTALADGNVLVFDNGVARESSRVLIIDPVTHRIEWEDDQGADGPFYTAVAGGCELLPDNSILVTDAQAGKAHVVDRDHRVTWRWNIPRSGDGVKRERTSLYRLAYVDRERVDRIAE